MRMERRSASARLDHRRAGPRERACRVNRSSDELERRSAGSSSAEACLPSSALRPSYEQSVMAAVLAAGEGAVASHFTAARLWGFPDVLADVGIEVTTDRPDQRRLRGVRTHRTNSSSSVEHTTRHGIPITTVARTLVDCTCLMSVWQLARALDRALREHQTTLRAVRTCVSGLRPAPGRRPTVDPGPARPAAPGLPARRQRLRSPAHANDRRRRTARTGAPPSCRRRGRRYVIDLAYVTEARHRVRRLRDPQHAHRLRWRPPPSEPARCRRVDIVRVTSEMSDPEVVRISHPRRLVQSRRHATTTAPTQRGATSVETRATRAAGRRASSQGQFHWKW